MRDTIANLVHPVLVAGLRLKQRVENGEIALDRDVVEQNLKTEQMALKALLLSEESKRSGEFGGEASDSGSMVSMSGSPMLSRHGMPSGIRRSADSFLGIRYILACWLDEIFIVDSPSPWDESWNEFKIEQAIYGTNDRAFMFWEQAKLAESRTGADALEVVFLCVMLGFRGDLRDDPDKLKAWCDQAKSRISQAQQGEFPTPPGADPPTNVPPLLGRDRLQNMLLVAALFVLLVIPVLAFLIVRQLMGS